MKKKKLLSAATLAAAGICVLAIWQHISVRRTLRKMREDYLKEPTGWENEEV